MTAASSARLLHEKSLKYIFDQYAEAQVDDQGKSFQDRLRNAQQQRADRHSLVLQGPSNPSLLIKTIPNMSINLQHVSYHHAWISSADARATRGVNDLHGTLSLNESE